MRLQSQVAWQAVSQVDTVAMWRVTRRSVENLPSDTALTSRFSRDGHANGRPACGAVRSGIAAPSGFRRRAGGEELLQGLD